MALSLLYGEYVRRIHINDLDHGIYSFWMAARDRTSDLCRRIQQAKIDMAEWQRQKEVQLDPEADELDLAFSTLFLNRTNRSGIISGGVIGGKEQSGKWKIDARFNKDDIIRRIERIGRWGSRIEIYNLDGIEFLKRVAMKLPKQSVLFLDPPYFIKGQELLYTNYYGTRDHQLLAAAIGEAYAHWIVTYNNTDMIRLLYKEYRSIEYDISYSAQGRYRGPEVAFFSHTLEIPAVVDPCRISQEDVLAF